MAPMPGRRSLFEIGKARRFLDWRPRPSADGVLQRAQSLIDQGLVCPAPEASTLRSGPSRL